MKRVFIFAAALLAGCFLNDRFHGTSGGDDMSIGSGDDMGPPPDMTSACQPACNGVTPICDATSTMCRACASNAECATATNAMQPVCSSTGACVGCTTGSDCPASAPICNTSTGTCGPCTAHSQCDSSVCYMGGCLSSSQIIYVNVAGSGCPAGPGMGTQAAPYCTVQKGFDIAAAQNKYVAVLSGTYTPTTGSVLTINNPTTDYKVTAFGIGTPTLSVNNLQGDVIAITNTTANHVVISMDGFMIANASNNDPQGPGLGYGVDLNGGSDKTLTQVKLTNCQLFNNQDGGFWLTNATGTLDQCTVDESGSIGINGNNSSLTITNTTVKQSGFYVSGGVAMYSQVAGVYASGGTLVMDKDTIGPKNGGAGISLSSTQFTITNTLVYKNGQAGVTDAAIEIAASPQPNQTLFNVTVADNAGNTPGIHCSTSQPIVANTVVFNNATPNQATLKTCTATNSAFFGGTSPNQDTNNCTDKVFVNATGGNYQPLTGGSPPCSLVGQGVNSVTPPGGTLVTTDHDIVGVSRPAGKYDIGAYQSH